MMKLLLWKILNIIQMTAVFVASVVLISLAMMVKLITFNYKEIGLKMAHWFWAPLMMKLSLSRVSVLGLENVDFTEPHIFVMNHQSALDIPLVFQIIPVPLKFVVKKELVYVPFLGWYIWAMDMIFVDRRNRDRAIQSLKRAGEKIRSGSNIIAYPEGTRSGDGSIGLFKKGTFVVAIESQVSVVPVAVEGTRFVMPKNSFAIRPAPITVSIGRPIHTRGLQHEDREWLMQETRNQLIDLHQSMGGLGGQKIYPEKSRLKVA